MHRTGGSASGSGAYFKVFGGNKTPTKTATRPSTSNGSHTAYSESAHSSTTSRTSGFSRNTSFSSASKSPKQHRGRSDSTGAPKYSSEREREKERKGSTVHTDSHPLPLPLPPVYAAVQWSTHRTHRSRSSLSQVAPGLEETPISPTESLDSTAPYSKMMSRPGTGYGGPAVSSTSTAPPVYPSATMQPPSPTLETITYQHIQETSSKRISTLDYLRKANEGRVYWFNTLLFNRTDLNKMPYFEARKMARRATNYLLLGISLPAVIDLNGTNTLEFLKTLNALLSEFDSFQQIHPPDGTSSLSRGRFPQMFKRAATTSKGRRTSSAAEIGLPMSNDQDSRSSSGSISAGGSGSTASFAIAENDLLPGEEYTFLLTPSLPFDPDFYETFATLCDVLIDCYTKLMSLIQSPRECNPVVAEMFTKADARVRKIIVQGVVKEFEDSSRGGVKSEVAGVGRVVLGGLM